MPKQLITAAELRSINQGTEIQRGKALERLNAAKEALKQAEDAFWAWDRELREGNKALSARLEADAKNEVARDRTKAQKLAKQFGITIEWESTTGRDGYWWVLGPSAICGGGDGVSDDGKPVRPDPCEGDHTCGAWCEVLANVEVYVADIQALGAEAAAQLVEAGQ